MAPQPRNVQELRSFLDLLHYYGKFLTGLAMLLHTLNHLLKAGQKNAMNLIHFPLESKKVISCKKQHLFILYSVLVDFLNLRTLT